MDDSPWVEKYRPTELEDVVAHQDIITTSTGKTTTILAIARKLFGSETAFRKNRLELNASDDRGIDVVRDEIKGFASSGQMNFAGDTSSTYKLVILDEADMMTTASQSALRRVIEHYTSNVRFCIICNHVYKIIPAIQSRCTRFRFGPLPEDQVEKRVRYVAAQEHVDLTEDGLRALLALTKGDMRRALNIMQASHSAFEVIDEKAVYSVTGQPYPADIEALLSAMMTQSFEAALSFITQLKSQKGLALQDIVFELYKHVNELDMPAHARVFLLQHMADIEYRLAAGCAEKLQLTSLLSATKIAVELAQK